MIGAALHDVPTRVADLREGVATVDGERIRTAAHTLAGSVANLGAVELVRLARALESLGKSGELSAAPGLLAALEAESGRVLAALVALSAAHTGAGAAAQDAP